MQFRAELLRDTAALTTKTSTDTDFENDPESVGASTATVAGIRAPEPVVANFPSLGLAITVAEK